MAIMVEVGFAVVGSGEARGSSKISLAAKIFKLNVGIHNRYLVPVYSGDVIVTTQNISNPFTFQVSRVW